MEDAKWWADQSLEWQQSFCEGTLLGPVIAMNDSRSVERDIGGDTVNFCCKYTACRFTLAIPAGTDRLWCRVHRLETADLDAPDGIKIIPPFCFPLDMKTFLLIEPVPV